MLDLVRDHLAAPTVGSSPAAIVAGHLHRGTPKAAAASLASGDDPTVAALRQLVTFHDQAWFPGGFAADATRDVLAVVHRDVQGAGADPGVAAAVELVTRSGGWRFLVIGSSRVAVEKGAAAAERMVGDLHHWLDRAVPAGDAGLVAHGLLVAADLLRLGGLADRAGEYCREAHTRFIEQGDLAGVGGCNLLVADAALTPWSSPELLGIDPWDLARAPHPVDAGAADRARNACAAADAAFRDAGSASGRAATALRLTYLAAVTGDPEAAAVNAATAVDLAAEADEAYRHLAATHRLVALVAAGHVGELRTCFPGDVANWAGNCGSASYARGLARILRGTGRLRLWAGDAEQARLLVTVASELVDGLRHAAERTACLEDASELYGALHSRGPAIGTLHGALEAYLAHDPLPLDEWMQAAAVLAALNGQYSAERHVEGQVWCRERAIELLARGPGSGPRAGEDLFAAARRGFDALPELGRRRVTADGRPQEDRFADEMAASVAASLVDTVAQASVLVPVFHGLQRRRDGLDVLACASLHEALRAATDLGERGTSLRILALAADRRYAEAAAVVRELCVAVPGFPVDLRVDLLVAARDYSEAARVLTGTPPPADVAVAERWRSGLATAEIALRTGDARRARELTTTGRADFERWFGGLDRDPFRVSVTDDVGARWLYLLAAEAALVDGDVAESLVLGDRLRALPLLRLLDALADDSPEYLAWQRATATWSAAYDLLAWSGMRAATRDPAVDPALDLIDPTTGAGRLLDVAQLDLEAAEARVGRRRIATLLEPPGMGELREHLPPGALLVQYLLAGDRLLVWALDADVVDGSAHTVDADQVAGHVRRVHAASARRYLPGDPEESRKELGRLLLNPVADHLTRHRRLVIVPSGPLNLLPFTVLPHGGDILGASHVMSILPATALLPRLAGERAEAGEVLVVGDPSFAEGTRLRRLPGTRVEALSVARHHGTVPLLGEQVTKAAVMQRLLGAGLVHLATHGLVSEIAPTASALALQGTDRLTVADLAGLRFDADLVVLSACDTGRGDTTIGGDVVGLARQLLAAGARAVVVSLWPVDDEATCLLMDEFHRRLDHGDAAAEALAWAQTLLRSLTAGERDQRYVELCQSVGEDMAPGSSRRRAWRTAPSMSRGWGGGMLRDAGKWAGFVLIGRP